MPNTKWTHKQSQRLFLTESGRYRHNLIEPDQGFDKANTSTKKKQLHKIDVEPHDGSGLGSSKVFINAGIQQGSKNEDSTLVLKQATILKILQNIRYWSNCYIKCKDKIQSYYALTYLFGHTNRSNNKQDFA
ncbi:42375_t:CDS:2 [Gigaspora margarita]|uniref:42375_t:CDS:1 n=1 Tax=Gigaspora margarita TaxID=4874 RepID=A0ABN7UD80_GIGMA|nr:42375_t:CDS:2 [Gigaspora margarita]